MNNSKTLLLASAVAAATAVGAVLLSSNIDPDHKFSWSENTGWWNWREANGSDEGVLVGDEFLTGYVWGENMGWIDVGAGDGPYANTTGLDFGVNILGSGDLDGYAWSENRGWINFGWAASTANPDRAWFDSSANRFRGYAWAENDGWINLDDATHYVAKEAPSLVPPGLPADAQHQARKHRYLSIDPTTNPQTPTVIKVEIAQMLRCQNDPRRGCLVDLDCRMVCEDDPNTLCPTGPTVCGGGNCINSGPCVDVTPMWDRFAAGQAPVAWLVQEPQQITAGCLAPGCNPATENCCGDEDWIARLSDNPYADADNWQDPDLLHISDCGIVPGVTYHVYACDPANISVCSEPLAVGTQATPSGTHLHFGDIAGAPLFAGAPYEPPDGFVNVVDVSAWGLTKQNYGTPASPQLHPTMADLHGSGYGAVANYILGLSDQQAIINHGFTWALPWDNPTMLGGVDPSTCPNRLP